MVLKPFPRKLCRNRKWLVPLFVSVCIIFFTSPSNYGIVCFLFNLSNSLLAATIFYLFIDFIPHQSRTKTMRNCINRKFRQVSELLNLCKSIIAPFDLDGYNKLSLDEYTTKFCSINLSEAYCLSKEFSNKQYLEHKKQQIERILTELLNFEQYLTCSELKLITRTLNSTLLLNEIRPLDFDVPDDLIHCYPNNQHEIAESIYCIYNDFSNYFKTNKQ